MKKWYGKILLLPKRMRHFFKRIATFLKLQLATLHHQSKDLQEQSHQMLSVSIDTLLIRTFYEILKTENLKLLLKPGEKASEKVLKDTWAELLDAYWKAYNPAKYETNIRRMMIETTKLNKFTTIRAALILAELGDEVGFETLTYFGIKTIKQAYSVLRVMETNAKLRNAKKQNDEAKKRAFNFYKDLVMLEQILNRSLDKDSIVVAQWIELVKIADTISKEKTKGKKKWQK